MIRNFGCGSCAHEEEADICLAIGCDTKALVLACHCLLTGKDSDIVLAEDIKLVLGCVCHSPVGVTLECLVSTTDVEWLDWVALVRVTVVIPLQTYGRAYIEALDRVEVDEYVLVNHGLVTMGRLYLTEVVRVPVAEEVEEVLALSIALEC